MHYYLLPITYYLIIIVFQTSCMKTDFTQIDAEELTFEPNNIESYTKKFTNDYAYFSSEDELNTFINLFLKCNSSTKGKIANSLKFKTQDDLLQEFYGQMPFLKTEKQFYDLIFNSGGLLKIIDLENGEKEVVELGVSQHPIQNILNEDGIIKVGNSYVKFLYNYCVISESISDLNVINSIDDIIHSGLEYKIVYTTLYSYAEDIQNRWGDLNEEIAYSLTKDEPWCVNDRRIKLTFQIVDITTSSIGEFVIKSAVAGSVLRGKRKGIPCIWYSYQTNLTWEDFHLEFDWVINDDAVEDEIWLESDETQNNVYKIERSMEFTTFVEGLDEFDCQWTKLESDCTSTGVGTLWLNVDWTL